MSSPNGNYRHKLKRNEKLVNFEWHSVYAICICVISTLEQVKLLIAFPVNSCTQRKRWSYPQTQTQRPRWIRPSTWREFCSRTGKSKSHQERLGKAQSIFIYLGLHLRLVLLLQILRNDIYWRIGYALNHILHAKWRTRTWLPSSHAEWCSRIRGRMWQKQVPFLW